LKKSASGSFPNPQIIGPTDFLNQENGRRLIGFETARESGRVHVAKLRRRPLRTKLEAPAFWHPVLPHNLPEGRAKTGVSSTPNPDLEGRRMVYHPGGGPQVLLERLCPR